MWRKERDVGRNMDDIVMKKIQEERVVTRRKKE